METYFYIRLYFYLLAVIMWSFEGSKFTKLHTKNMAMLLFLNLVNGFLF